MKKYIYWKTIELKPDGNPKTEKIISKEEYDKLKNNRKILKLRLKRGIWDGSEILIHKTIQIAKKERIWSR